MSEKDDKDFDEKAFKEAYDEAMEYAEKEFERIWDEAQNDPTPDWWIEMENAKTEEEKQAAMKKRRDLGLNVID
ncbi:MAG: hypothetical protein ACI4LM_00875 [Anaerovoracaceae bacterium]